MTYSLREAPMCQCGQLTGVPCSSEITGGGIVLEYLPDYSRANQIAAGGVWVGMYPYNGAKQAIVSEECAEALLDDEPDWCRVVG